MITIARSLLALGFASVGSTVAAQDFSQCDTLNFDTAQTGSLDLYSLATGRLQRIERLDEDDYPPLFSLKDCGDDVFYAWERTEDWERAEDWVLVEKTDFARLSCVCQIRTDQLAIGGAPGAGAVEQCPIEQC